MGTSSISVEQTLKKRERMLALLSDNIPSLVAFVGSDQRILYANRAFREWATLDDIAGKPLMEILGKTRYEEWTDRIERVLHGESLRETTTYAMPGDEPRHYEARFAPLQNRNGEADGFFVFISDVTEQADAHRALEESRTRLRALGVYRQQVLEEERRRIAREIHDELGQTLTALKMDVTWVQKRLADAAAENQQERDRLDSMVSLVDTTIQSVKRISSELRPGHLDDLGLSAAIEWLAEEFERRSGIRTVSLISPSDFEVADEMATALFRVAQEATTNVARHAKASRVDIVLRQNEIGVTLEVIDDGVGLDARRLKTPHSFGLIGIRERLYPFGGIVSIERRHQGGTRLIARIPAKVTNSED